MMDAGTVRALDPGLVPMTPQLAHALARASEAASISGGREVTLEHLLKSLIDDEDALAVLDSSRVDVNRLRYEIATFVAGLPPASGDGREFGVSTDTRRILEAASAAARGGRRRDINGAIVLAAIVGDGQSVAAQLLQNQGLTFDEAIRALQRAAAAPARETPVALPAADDVLARARERVQSRSQPSLRQMIEGAPKSQVAVIQSPPDSYLPAPPVEADADAFANQATDRAPQEPPASIPPDDVETLLNEAAAISYTAATPSAPIAEPYVQQQPVADELTLGEGSPMQWDFEHAAPAVTEPSFEQPTQSAPLPLPLSQEFAPGPYSAASAWPVSPPFPSVTQPRFEPHDHAPQQEQRVAVPRPVTAQPPPIPHWAPSSLPNAGADFGFPGGFGAPAHEKQPGRPVPDPFALPTGDGFSHPRLRAEPGFGEPPPPSPQPLHAARPPAVQNFPMQAAVATMQSTRRNAASGEIGQFAENIPRAMRVGVTERVEIRIAKASVAALIEGLDGGRTAWRHDIIIAKGMSVRLRAPDGGVFIETASPETQWIENQLGFAGDDFASWRFLVTPQYRGWASLQIIVSARTIGADGVAAETALPDQIVDVKVRTNYRRALARFGGWAIAALVGGVLAKFGEAGFDIAQTLIARFAN